MSVCVLTAHMPATEASVLVCLALTPRVLRRARRRVLTVREKERGGVRDSLRSAALSCVFVLARLGEGEAYAALAVLKGSGVAC